MESNVKVTGQSNLDFLYKGYIDYTDQWFLMSSPVTPLMIVAAYLLFVLRLGPAYMKDRPAYSLRKVIIFYNAAQVLYSCYVLAVGLEVILEEGLWEKKCFLQDKEYTYKTISAGYLYLIAKLTELLDTIFFVLRKKWNQISFLHVYHHTIMFTTCWFCFKYCPSYTFAILAIVNTFVHVIMYTYYGLSAFPGLAKYLWWKKYITKLQLVQFFIVFLSINVNYFTSKCPQSFFLLLMTWVHFFLFTYLFAKFYINSYGKEQANIKNVNAKITLEEKNY